MFSGLTAGTAAYLSPSSAGALTNTPNAFGPVLMPTSATAGYVLSNADSVTLFTSPANTRASLGLPNVYEADLTQGATDAPVAANVKNQLGGTPVYAYADIGNYTLTITGAFPVGTKAWIQLHNGSLGTASALRINDNTVQIYSYDNSFSVADDVIEGATLFIQVG